MILKDIVEDVNIEGIKESLKNLYFHEDQNNLGLYIKLFEQLKSTPVKPSENHMTLHVEFIEDFGNKNCIWSATYSLYKSYKRKYSLEFTTIDEIANANVLIEQVKNKEDYIAHILWEFLYNRQSEEEENLYQEEEKKRRQMKKIEYCSIEDVLESMEEDVFE